MGSPIGTEFWEESLDRELRLLAAQQADDSPPATESSTPENPVGNRPVRDGRTVSLRELRMEIHRVVSSELRLDEDIYDDTGALIYAAGSRITREFVQLLRKRGVLAEDVLLR